MYRRTNLQHRYRFFPPRRKYNQFAICGGPYMPLYVFAKSPLSVIDENYFFLHFLHTRTTDN